MNFIEKVKKNNKRITKYEKLINKTKSLITKNILFEKSFPMKSNYNPIIPLNIFQTWHSKTLPTNMAKTVIKIKKLNPRFTYYLFDDTDCEKFIGNHFKPDVLDAYRSLIPGAYKADLWRYCVLFIKGGIYLDIKYKPHNNFRFINLMEQEHFCLDIDGSNIYNAVIICNKGNKSCLKSIRQIVKHVQTKFYGGSSLDITGPGLLARCITGENKQNINLKHHLVNGDCQNRYITYKGYCILHQYPEYLIESGRYGKTAHYSALWGARQVYR